MENYLRPNILNMGVINLTPNSFSEAKPQDIQKSFCELLNDCKIIDLGAESTAPMNVAIDAKTEFCRFEKYFFPVLDKMPDPKVKLSIDTYRPEVFYELYFVIKSYWPSTKLIFNDVSGKIDDDLVLLLKDSGLHFEYIFSHNLCPNRDMTTQHMSYVSPNEEYVFLQELVNYFASGLKNLSPYNKKIWIDPCFGFSKTRGQNHYLLKHFASFVRHFPNDLGVVYGISRKSFLKFPTQLDAKNELVQRELDHIQTALMVDLLKTKPFHEIIFRSHNQLSLKSALKTCLILE